jgi:hypothetical protein
MIFTRRIETGPGWVADMTIRGLRWQDASGAVQRPIHGDLPPYLPCHVAVACTPDASRVWAGVGTGQIYALGPQASGPPELLEGHLSDVLFWDGRLWGAETDDRRKLKRLVWRSPSARSWEERPLPRPAKVASIPSFTVPRKLSHQPDQVALFGSRWGLAVVEKGRGRVAVIRPGGEDVFCLELQSGAEEDLWFAAATDEGVLVAMVANHRHSAIAHLSDTGKHLGLVTHVGQNLLWSVTGLIPLEDEGALALWQDGILRLTRSSLAAEPVSPYSMDHYVTAAPRGPGRWLLAPQDEAERLYTLRVGPDSEVEIEEIPLKKAAPGEALCSLGYASARLEWQSPRTPTLSVAAPLSETWSRTFINQGKPATGIRVTLQSPLLASRLVEITSLRVGEREERVRMLGPLVATAEFDGLPVSSGASVPVSVVFRGRGEGESEVQIKVEPLAEPHPPPGAACSDSFRLRLE